MGRERTPGGIAYDLVALDAEGAERADDAGWTSAELLRRVAADPPTDVFLMSHGWNGDVPAARDQYDRWVDAMAACEADRAAAHARPGGARALPVGVHWPSRPWGDERLGDGSFAADPGRGEAEGEAGGEAADDLVAGAVAAFGDTPEVRAAVRTLLASALDDAVPVTLPSEAREAYRALDAASGLGAAGQGASPGADRAPFDPEATYQASLQAELASFGGTALGGVLAPLRVLSFWRMKRRAQEVGAGGVARLLAALLDAAPDARVHLMGHSFGCIVVSAALAATARSRPVASLVLVQGAMSHWSFCSSIPSEPTRTGFFRPVVASGRVAGPVVVTTSVHDRAVGVFYPLGAGLRGQVDYAPGELPVYGAIGALGVRGPGLDVVDEDLHDVGEPYDLRRGSVHVLRADDVIATPQGLMGAHSDITGPPVAHAVWQAALTGG